MQYNKVTATCGLQYDQVIENSSITQVKVEYRLTDSSCNAFKFMS
jgi:hypothetical protein